jgi:hypothetical protein
MSLQLIARDLYRLHQQVEQLQKQLATTPPAQRDAIRKKLIRAQVERDEVKRMLDGRLDR